MKVLLKLSTLCIIVIAFSCSSDDDNGNDGQEDLNVGNLLRSGKWYQESISPGGISDCEKNTNIEFNENGDFFIETFDDDTGPCKSSGLETGTYTLTNNRDISIMAGTEVINVVIDAITAQLMTVTTSDGETVTFDKVQG